MDNRFYEEFKTMRQYGMGVREAFNWAKFMRDCNYQPFEV